MEPIIQIKNVGKRYNIVHERERYITMRDILANILHNPFKFLFHKAKDLAGFTVKEEFWALRNINLDIYPGEVIGIIGHNGAGKSTLLKILTGITPPTTGSIIMKGKVASLLEVGTGFHPELTGRENVFLNGAILGMSKKEIEAKFDKIVEFSGVERFLDTPVKRYSSGMYVRLAFSVAAHMEPDILLVDEVLAVGDSEFQKKSLGKLDSVSKTDNRTIFFVSHNMHAIQKLCTKCVLLDRGEIKMVGDTKEVIKTYLDLSAKINGGSLELDNTFDGMGGLVAKRLTLTDGNHNIAGAEEGGGYTFTLHWNKKIDADLTDIECAFAIHNSEGLLVTRLSSRSVGITFTASKQTGTWTCHIDKNLLPRGEYYSNIRIDSARGMEYWKVNAFSFTVHPGSFQNKTPPLFHNHIFHQPQNWSNE